MKAQHLLAQWRTHSCFSVSVCIIGVYISGATNIREFDPGQNQVTRGLTMKNKRSEATAIHSMWRRWVAASSFIALALHASFAIAEYNFVGKVAYVDGGVYIQETLEVQGSSMLGGQRALQLGDEISVHDALKTLEDSTIKVIFVDGAEITLRQDSSIFIEKYSKNEAEIEIIKGGIRVVTGEIAKQNPKLFKVVTHDGVVTAQNKGSDFLVRICVKDCDEENKNMTGPMMKTELPAIAKVVAMQGEVVVGRQYKRQLDIGYPIYSTEHIESGKNSFAQFQFIDGSSVTLQAEGILDIRNYEYSVAGKEDVAAFDLIEGGVRFVTGAIGKNNPGAFSLNTTVATVGVNGTDFTVNCVGNCSSGGIVSHVIDGSIIQRNQSGAHVLKSGSYGAISSQQSSPIVTPTAPVAFNNNIAPPPSLARVDTESLFSSIVTTVEPGTHVSVKAGQVTLAGPVGEPVVVGANLSAVVGKSRSAETTGGVSDFQILDSTYTAPYVVVSAPAPSINTIVIGGPSRSSINSVAGPSTVNTIVIQEMTIASPYSFR